MGTLNVGDRFRRTQSDAHNVSYRRKGYGGIVKQLGDQGFQDHNGWYHSYENVERISSSPFREVVTTRLELVPGYYGRVCVNEIKSSNSSETCSVTMSPTLDPQELRDAARLILEIADVLEKKE